MSQDADVFGLVEMTRLAEHGRFVVRVKVRNTSLAATPSKVTCRAVGYLGKNLSINRCYSLSA